MLKIGTLKLKGARVSLNDDTINKGNKACILVMDAKLASPQKTFLEKFLNKKILQNDFNVHVG